MYHGKFGHQNTKYYLQKTFQYQNAILNSKTQNQSGQIFKDTSPNSNIEIQNASAVKFWSKEIRIKLEVQKLEYVCNRLVIKQENLKLNRVQAVLPMHFAFLCRWHLLSPLFYSKEL